MNPQASHALFQVMIGVLYFLLAVSVLHYFY